VSAWGEAAPRMATGGPRRPRRSRRDRDDPSARALLHAACAPVPVPSPVREALAILEGPGGGPRDHPDL
jgi:hypothetical protein